MVPDGPGGYQTHALVTAATAEQVSWLTELGRLTGGRVWREKTALCVQRKMPLNQVEILFPARLEPGAVERILAWSEEAGVRTVGCWTSGLGDDERVRDILEPRGFTEGWQPHWMYARLPLEAAAPDARIEEVTEVPDYDEYGQTLLEMTRVRPRDRRSWHYVAREDGKLAGMIWLHTTDMAPGRAGLFDIYVNPDMRRRGVGSALTAAACAHATELGCLEVTLNATLEGERLNSALGFRTLGHGRTWWRHLEH
jgi:GNAT superfamily N-acetyltransferase